MYKKYHEKMINLPQAIHYYPSKEALQLHYDNLFRKHI